MKKLRNIAFIVAIIALVSIFTIMALSSPPPQGNPDNEISIMFTADLHTNFDPVRFAQEDGSVTMRGGFARMQTVIDQVRQSYPNSFILDAGDFSMGTLFQTVFNTHAPEVRMMGHLGFDAAVIGNHEFDYRGSGLTEMLNAAVDSGDRRVGLTLSNIDWERSFASPELADGAHAMRAAMDRYGAADYLLIERGGVTAAIFGVMGPRPIAYSPTADVYFFDYIEAARTVVAHIQAETNADIIIALSHSGINRNDPENSACGRLAVEVPGIDIIISGHAHVRLEEPIVIGNTIIVSAGANTFDLGHVTLAGSSGNFHVTSHRLIPITEDIPKNMDVQERIEEFRIMVNEYYLSHFDFTFDQVLAYSTFSFTPREYFGRHLGEEPIGNLISNSFKAAVRRAEGANHIPVDVAVVPRGNIRASFAAGPITVADTFAVSSLGIGADRIPGFPLVSVWLTGRELRTAAEIDISVSPMMSSARLYMSGLTYTFNPNRLMLNRVTSVQVMDIYGNISELENDRLYRVVAGLYATQMLGAVEELSFGLLRITPKDMHGNPIVNFEDHIIHYGDTELKEWVALAWYLQSFDEVGGVPRMPYTYNQLLGRKIEVNSRSPIELLRSPNRFFFMLVGVVLLVLAIIIVPTVFIVKGVRKRKRRKLLEGLVEV